MKRKILSVLLTLVLVLSFSLMMVVPVEAAKPAGKGFDQWGYNYQARIFNGPFGYVDENRTNGDGNVNTIWGSPTDSYGYYDTAGNFHGVVANVAGSHLVMKWSEVWHMAVFGPDGQRNSGDEEPWGQGAWCTNHVEGTGTIYDIDGTIIYQGHLTILSKIKWVGDTTGYTNPIWGTMAVIQKVVSKQGAVFREIQCGPGLGPVSP